MNAITFIIYNQYLKIVYFLLKYIVLVGFFFVLTKLPFLLKKLLENFLVGITFKWVTLLISKQFLKFV